MSKVMFPRGRIGFYPNPAIDLSDEVEVWSLRPRADPYWMAIGHGRALGLVINEKTELPSRWKARYRHKDKKGYRTRWVGPYFMLEFSQAEELAKRWFAEKETDAIPEKPYPPEVPVLERSGTPGEYTVTDALNDYLSRHGTGGSNSRHEYNKATRINHYLGEMPVNELTSRDILRWRSLALAEYGTVPNPQLDEMEVVRRHKATINRQLGTLRAALDHAFKTRKTDSYAEWHRVSYFKNAQAPAPEPVSPDAIQELRRNATPDLRNLIDAALYTGCRLVELINLRCKDLIPSSKKLQVPPAKRSSGRNIVLSEEGYKFLSSLSLYQQDDDWLLRRYDGRPWSGKAASLQLLRFAKQSELTRAVNFHRMRHTYATRLRDAGMPLELISRQLGHKNLRTTQDYYVGTDESAGDEIIRSVLSRDR